MSWLTERLFADLPPPSPEESLRTILLGERIVPYVLRRSRRRSIGLTIDRRGLRVGAPHRATLTEVETLIRHHASWVTQKLEEWRSRPLPERLPVSDGMRLPVLGEPLEVRLAAGNNRFAWQEAPAELTLFLRTANDAGKLLEKAIRARALAHFIERTCELADRMGLAQPALALSSARTRWGSCSQRSGIRLHWRLLHFPAPVIDYVIVHELSHLREMNHSPRFWAIVETFCPDYRSLRAELNRLASRCPDWTR